ncbi:MAG: hypothetical protein Q9227_005926 [Pyrenula ochraceoflavens]
MSDLDTLVDMGFDRERAEIAIAQGKSVEGAVQWLETNQDRDLAELKEQYEAEGASIDAKSVEGVAQSLVCDDCGKKFRDESQAQYHASKSGHANFSQSVDEIAPLTEEERAAKLAELRARANERKAAQSVQDKAEQKRNEEIRRKNTKETQDAKEDLKRKEQMKEAEKKRREKQEDVEAKQRIKAKIAADKEERRLRTEREKAEREGRAAPPPPAAAPAPTASGPTTSKPASAYTETRIRFQLPTGMITKTFPVETTLFEVAAELSKESGIEVQNFTQTFPKKVFDHEFFGESLKELKMVPSASLIVK